MNDNLQGPMQSAFSRVLPKVAPATPAGLPPSQTPVVPPKAVAATTKSRQVYNAMVATPGQTVRFYAAAAELSYNGTYNYLIRMQEAGFARQASLPNSVSNTKYWRATAQWNDDAWDDAGPNTKPKGKVARVAPPKPPRPELVPAPARVIEAQQPLDVAARVPEADMMGYRLAEAKPAAINLDNLTIGEARKLYDALKKLFG